VTDSLFMFLYPLSRLLLRKLKFPHAGKILWNMKIYYRVQAARSSFLL